MDNLFQTTITLIYNGQARLTTIETYLVEGKWYNINDLENWAAHEFPIIKEHVHQIDLNASINRRNIIHNKNIDLISNYIRIKAFADKMIASRAKTAKR